MPASFRRPRSATNGGRHWWPYEQSAYFVDATTRLSWLINDPGISRRRDANLDYILEHSSGTNFGGSHWCWPNAVVGRALMAQFSATGDPRVAAAMQNWLLTSADAIAKGGRNGVNFEEAFYLYGVTGDPRLAWNCAARSMTVICRTPIRFAPSPKFRAEARFREHGVTAAEELKCLPLMFSYTGDRAGPAAGATRLPKSAGQQSHGRRRHRQRGTSGADRVLFSVHESCDITDWSWSLGYLFMATGEARLADLIERATFNALPGAVTKDFKQLQYFSAVNQTEIAATNSHTASLADAHDLPRGARRGMLRRQHQPRHAELRHPHVDALATTAASRRCITGRAKSRPGSTARP